MRFSPNEAPVERFLLEPQADAAGRTSTAYVSLKNAIHARICFLVDQGNAATILISPVQATAVAGTGTKVLTNVVRIWANQDCATNADSTEATAAKNFTTSAAVKIKTVEFDIDPTNALDVAGNFDCIGLTTGASNAANITSATLLIWPKHSGATAPSYIAD